jgi:hypothetical protein
VVNHPSFPNPRRIREPFMFCILFHPQGLSVQPQSTCAQLLYTLTDFFLPSSLRPVCSPG